MNVFIYPNLKKKNSLPAARRACELLYQGGVLLLAQTSFREILGDLKGISFFSSEECMKRCDIAVAAGGDGTILRCSKLASRYDKPILGINCGRMGFMASLESSEIEKVGLLCTGRFTVSDRMMLNASVEKADGETVSADLLNDIVISKSDDCKIVDFEVCKSGRIISSLRADGIIFSTPTGATAYSLSAGGPIIEPEMQCIEFSQICAHSLFSRSVVFSPDTELDVRCRCKHDAHTIISADGSVLSRVSSKDTVRIVRSKLTTKIIDITNGRFFSTVNQKLMKPLKDV